MKLRNRLELAPLSSGQALIAGGAGSTAFLLEQVIDRRLTQNRYDDLVLLGGMVSRYRRLQLLLGTLAHYTFGIALAVVYDAAKPALPRLPGWLRGLIFAQAEGVATGKGPGSAAVSLTRLGLVQYFDVVESGAAEGPIKPRSIQRVLARWGLSPQQAAYVGDSPFDVDAAHEGLCDLHRRGLGKLGGRIQPEGAGPAGGVRECRSVRRLARGPEAAIRGIGGPGMIATTTTPSGSSTIPPAGLTRHLAPGWVGAECRPSKVTLAPSPGQLDQDP